MKIMQLRAFLLEEKDNDYKVFSSKLIPNINNILGVRLPKLRQIAKDIASNNDFLDFIYDYDDIYFEETMIKGLSIGYSKLDLDDCLPLIEYFIPKIDNWSTCDSFCNTLKIVAKNRDFFWSFIEKYFKSKSCYEVRFATVLTLNYFIDEKYIVDFFQRIKTIENDDYYVDMAVAWAISYFFIDYKDLVLDLFNQDSLSPSIQNKTIQKIRDSKKVDLLDKNLVLKYKK